jgi:hypothetical protein
MASLVSVDDAGRGYFGNDGNREKRARFSENVWFVYSVLAEDHKVVSRLNKEKLAFDRSTVELPGKELVDLFASLKKGNAITFNEFKAKFMEMVNAEAKKPETEYVVVYPLNMELPRDAAQELGIGQHTFGKAAVEKGTSKNPFDFGFQIVSYKEFVKEFPTFDPNFLLIEGEKGKQIKSEILGLFNDDHVFFVTREYARNPSYAEGVIRKRFKAFLGLWILIKNVEISRFFSFCWNLCLTSLEVMRLSLKKTDLLIFIPYAKLLCLQSRLAGQSFAN